MDGRGRVWTLSLVFEDLITGVISSLKRYIWSEPLPKIKISLLLRCWFLVLSCRPIAIEVMVLI